MKDPELLRQAVHAGIADSKERLELFGKLLAIDDTVYREAVAVFGARGAGEWLTSPALGLGGRVPVDVAATGAGAAEVVTLITRIDRGTAC
jgi:uncharacterized protein (DUF2384 family)